MKQWLGLEITEHKKTFTALVAIMVLLCSAFTCNWGGVLSTAEQDLPTLLQIALGIAQIVAIASPGTVAPSDYTAITSISSQAGQIINTVQALVNGYKANPNATTLQKLQAGLADADNNLTQLLQSAHIKDPTLQARIATALNLLITTVAEFQAAFPTTVAAKQKTAEPSYKPMSSSQLKTAWNTQVCAPSGNPRLDAAFRQVVLK